MTQETRALLIHIRRLLLTAVDLIERECQMGKHATPQTVTLSPSDSIAGIIPESRKEISCPSESSL
jgi:hypothetical protein